MLLQTNSGKDVVWKPCADLRENDSKCPLISIFTKIIIFLQNILPKIAKILAKMKCPSFIIPCGRILGRNWENKS
jgi:hypothetical protein